MAAAAAIVARRSMLRLCFPCCVSSPPETQRKRLVAARPPSERGLILEDLPPRPPGRCRKRALLVGINYPGTSGELHGCCNDVRRMHKFLTSECGWSSHPETMMVLTDEKGSGLVAGAAGVAAPTRANMITAMRWLACRPWAALDV